ncbi:N-acetyltransferase [Streptomyces sp. SID8379]|uniref:GNAT family N-acetyltransferase n=1 Tax=unclassified Streptomyces TaxID=2593676 RepID=UPI00036AC3AB|nr:MULTISPECIES: GNAT family N-acetyltransferase [unclassified Streptomyces]MYW63331.1 N-acetyltransferase [Streptomyces sp. SID8379]
MSDTEIHDDRDAGFLRARVGGADGEVAGYLQYLVLDEPRRALVPVHTVVEPEHEGKGIAGSLARELYAIAAREAMAVAPLCPFVVRWAARHPGEAPAVGDELIAAAKAAVEADPHQW